MGDIMDDWFGIESPKPPATPDPAATAGTQYAYNKQAAIDQAMLNAIDQYGPYGSTIWARRDDGTPYAQSVTLSPEVQQWLDSQFGASTSLMDAAQKQLGYLPENRFQLPESPGARDYAAQGFGERALDYSQFADPMAGEMYKSSAVDLAQTPGTQDIANTFYNQAVSRFQPQLDEAKKAKEIELARRGIPVGSEIYNDEMNRMERTAGQTYSDAARQAELAAGQEQSRLYGQNLSTAQYGGQEQQRLSSADLANRSFLGTQENQQYNRLAQALGYGTGQYQTNLSNQLLERNQPYAEAAALMGTSPTFQTPSFQSAVPSSVAAPDYSGLVSSIYGTQMGAYNNAQNQSSGLMGGLLGAAGKIGAAAAPLIFSDEDLKEKREPADGEHILALMSTMPVDDYEYKNEAQEALGVPEHRTGPMAQDYAKRFPEGSDGRTIDIGDMIGKLMAAMKSLDQRTRHLSPRMA